MTCTPHIGAPVALPYHRVPDQALAAGVPVRRPVIAGEVGGAGGRVGEVPLPCRAAEAGRGL